MSAAVFTAMLPLVISFAEIAALGLAFAALMALSLRVGIFNAIHGVSRTTYGEICFPLGIAALAVICPSELPFAFGVLVLGVCDSLAALVGGRYGRRVVPLVETRKTLWGTGTFLVACFALGVMLMLPTGVSVSYALAAAAAMAIALTPVELFLTYGLDNLVLPIVAGCSSPRYERRRSRLPHLSAARRGSRSRAGHRAGPPPVARPPARLRPHLPRRADPRLQQDWRGPLVMSTVAVLVVLVQSELYALDRSARSASSTTRRRAGSRSDLRSASAIRSSSSPTASSSAGSEFLQAEPRAQGHSCNTSSTRPTR